jgi:signal transduction histidine kinase
LLQSPELIPDCGDCLPPNPFALWPNLAAFEAVEVASNIAIGGLVTAIGIVALRRLLRAGPLVRRARAPILLAGGVAMSASAYDTFEYAWSTATGSLFLEPSEPWATLISWMWFGARTLVPIGFLLATLRLRSQPGPLGRLAAGLDTSGGEASVGEALRLALGDPSLVMLRPDGAGSGWRDEAGNPAELPSTGAARSMTRIGSVEAPLAMLVHDPALVDQPELVAAVSRVLGLALENERLEAELRKQLAEVTASRERIVTATEEERRRIERDLHDGAQQRLVALAMRLEAARGTSADARALIDATTSELGTAIAEVRNLARGIHPPILTEAGLRAAIDSLAERAPLPIEVDADDQRYPEQIEATAYFVAAEALTNVARHANASHARVTIRRENGTLVLEIADDGRGGADAVRGSGLSGLEDRVAATRGALEVESRDGTGTTLRVRLPLEVAGA